METTDLPPPSVTQPPGQAAAGAAEPALPAERISPAEERFERWRRVAGAVLAPLAFGFVYFVLLRGSALPEAGRRLGAILAAVAVLWVSEALPLPVTALLGACLCIVLGVADAETVLAPFADPMIFLFMGSFMLARAMETHRLDRRVALRFLSVRFIGGRPPLVLGGMGAVCAGLSMWVSNTATAAMMMPIAAGVLAALHEVRVRAGAAPAGPLDARAWPFATAMMLMVAYGSSVGGIGTPVGSPPNLITLRAIQAGGGPTISFFTWMKIMVPLMAAMMAALFVLLYALHRGGAPGRRRERIGADRERDAGGHAEARVDGGDAGAGAQALGLERYLLLERDRLGPWTRGQVNTLIAFAVAVTLWVLPGVLQAADAVRFKAAVDFFGKSGQMPEAIVALLAALLLFVLPVNLREGRFTLTWQEAVRIDWGVLLLFGSGIALGELMMSKETGVARALGEWAVAQTGAQGVWTLTATMIVLSIALSEATSNTAAAVMLTPIAVAMANQMGVSPIPPALGAGIGASYGFMLPVSTAPNAIVFGSGLVPISRMMRAGLLFDVIGAAVIWAGLRVLLPPLGLA